MEQGMAPMERQAFLKLLNFLFSKCTFIRPEHHLISPFQKFVAI